MTGPHHVLPVTEASQPAAARFLVREIAESAGFREEDIHRAAIVATELGTNLVRHAKGGQFAARVTAAPPHGEIELIAIDTGPGMRDVAACLADGHSTAGTPGTGLGAVRRLSDTFDLFSDERGTVVVSRLRADRSPEGQCRLRVGAISIPKRGETVCGDAWTCRHEAQSLTIVLADGLGHGLEASRAAEAALHAFRSRRCADNVQTLQNMHDGIRHTRGAAAAIAAIRHDSGVVHCVGVGNIATAVCRNGSVRMAVTHNGTLGHDARLMREYTYPWVAGGVMVMHSDGLATHWSLDRYRGLSQRHPTVIASVLYRDYTRDRDDVTVVVAKEAA